MGTARTAFGALAAFVAVLIGFSALAGGNLPALLFAVALFSLGCWFGRLDQIPQR